MIINFVGRVRIIDTVQRGDVPLPFTVEVFDDETSEHDVRLERGFKTREEAEAYAKGLTALFPAFDLTVPIIRDGEPRTLWSVSAVISAKI